MKNSSVDILHKIKMKMKNYLLTLLVLAMMPALAQNEKDAEKLLESVINKTASYSNFKAQLAYTMVNAEMNIDEKKTGVIYVQGDSYRIEMEGQEIISDGKTVWTYLPDSKEVMVSEVLETEESFSPTKILTQYNDDYDARFDADSKYKNANLKVINLKASEGKNFDRISVTVNLEKLSLESFSMYDKDGNVFTYQIVLLEPNLNLSANTFVFNVKDYPGVDVVDMR
ncbi:MAG: hypothetical protein COW63_10390 [Bacteroidetes bacterium CG18_big_fil_WC_8_21_14_2_50_41_14]|nr:MAG: hypothetical protein COW63_10390 [Bacteroidetes bacterium CG18_big_fil_WC_8_21_14_2_50_41_14]PIY34234.1 MAG: hypothetical protein COZ08_03005 [Bacteroidetes bacterium CG_4_10_14_3_um_filter_42_6]PJB58982.1 MAG: hypothetical protein CO098_05805 [Bacteroidetes bacterium CG_4_9_14_3_um_filter_41_19]